MSPLIECVPNFSEGRDRAKIEKIVSAIAGSPLSSDLLCYRNSGVRYRNEPLRGGSGLADGRAGTDDCGSNFGSNDNCGSGCEEGVRVLHVDPNPDANRTVVTFVGRPEAVVEAAFRGVRAAAQVIDMRFQHGEHPRSGATDVLPLVPVSGISLEECARLARELAKRIWEELGIPSYCYEAAAFSPERRKLENCRKGEYEALPEKMASDEFRPDFGPTEFNETVARAGAINIGARKFLIAVNFNLSTASVEAAKDIAAEIRESGRVVIGPDGTKVRIPGKLKGCKAIGWYMENYGFAQVSMNITDIDAAPLHMVYEEVCQAAAQRGLKVTGTEIIGLVPRQCLVDAGRYFAERRDGVGDGDVAGDVADGGRDGRGDGGAAEMRGCGAEDGSVEDSSMNDEDMIDLAIHTLGLSSIQPFLKSEKLL